MNILKKEIHLPVSIEEAWSFFSDPKNLSRITPPQLNFSITSDLPESIYSGLIITYKVSPVLSIPLSWVTEITHCNPPFYFVDEQRFGPYAFWHHTHHFEESDKGTICKDIVYYKIPFQGLLPFVHHFYVRPELEKIFDYREKVLEEIFGT